MGLFKKKDPIVEVEKAVVGKREVIEKILMALLADGHVLLDDIPGVGKTTLAVALSRTLGLTYNRIQFTPDVLPSDIVGFSIYNKDSGCFEYKSGVVSNTNLLLGDEINRTSSKTQSALLEAMEERQITVDGRTYPLEKPVMTRTQGGRCWMCSRSRERPSSPERHRSRTIASKAIEERNSDASVASSA